MYSPAQHVKGFCPLSDLPWTHRGHTGVFLSPPRYAPSFLLRTRFSNATFQPFKPFDFHRPCANSRSRAFRSSFLRKNKSPTSTSTHSFTRIIIFSSDKFHLPHPKGRPHYYCCVNMLPAFISIVRGASKKEKMELHSQSHKSQNEKKSEPCDFCANRENGVFFPTLFYLVLVTPHPVWLLKKQVRG